MLISIDDISEIAKKIVNIKREVSLSTPSISSKNVAENGVFFAFPGKKAHGGDFIPDAYGKGAAAVVVDSNYYENKRTWDSGSYTNIIIVEDTGEALLEMAKTARRKFNGKVLGITGSCGKTTAKDMTAFLLSARYKVLKTEGNLNNRIGLPLNILRLSGDEDIAVFEMGASSSGEIYELSSVADPDIGVILNVFPSHLKGFGGIDGVYKGKLELAEYLDRKNATLILNIDDERLYREAGKYNLSFITYSVTREADFYISDTGAGVFGLMFEINGRYRFFAGSEYPLHYLPNLLAALSSASLFEIDINSAVNKLLEFGGSKGRFSVYKKDSVTVVDDTYNANPDSFKAGLRSISRYVKNRTFLVCADMLELGDMSAYYHSELAADISAVKPYMVILYGSEVRVTYDKLKKSGVNALLVDSIGKIYDILRSEVKRGDLLYLKGSRGMRLDKVVLSFLGRDSVVVD